MNVSAFGEGAAGIKVMCGGSGFVMRILPHSFRENAFDEWADYFGKLFLCICLDSRS